MKRDSLSSSLKGHCIGNSSIKARDLWNTTTSSQSYGSSSSEDVFGGFSWPPRSYRCSFCQREFRSAQALGGHMNVHRRDRARLRQSPPPQDGQCPSFLNLNPNPSPSLSPSTFSTCTLPSLVSSPPPPPPPPPPYLSSLSSPSCEIKKWAVDHSPILEPLTDNKDSDLTRTGSERSLFGAKEFEGCKFLKKGEIVRLDLEIGLISDPKEDLDLELRLGYS